MSDERKKALLNFCLQVGLSFEDLDLLDLAFTHRSLSNERANHENNERLEFLGDSVLSVVSATYLYNLLPTHDEGFLSKVKAQAVSEKTLALVARKFGLDNLLLLGRGEELSGGREKSAILADCMEAIIGAFYIDKGFEAAQKYILSWLSDQITAIIKEGTGDYKSKLQELSQKNFLALPTYETVSSSGPDHEKSFSVIVKVGGSTFGPATGTSKKNAEQEAARQALKTLAKSGF